MDIYEVSLKLTEKVENYIVSEEYENNNSSLESIRKSFAETFNYFYNEIKQNTDNK